MQTSKKNRRHGWLIAFLALFCVMALLWSVSPRERGLMNYATRIQGVDFQSQGSLIYGWQSPHELLVFRQHPLEDSSAPLAQDTADYRAIRLDTTTGKKTELPLSFKMLRNYMDAPRPTDPGFPNGGCRIVGEELSPQIAPDGKAVLWSGVDPAYYNSVGFSDRFVALATANNARSYFRQSHDREGSAPVWLPDSRHWVERRKARSVKGQAELCLDVHSLEAPQAIKTIPLPISTGYFLIITQDQILFWDSSRLERKTIDCSLWNLNTPLSHQKVTLNFPIPASILSAVLCPDGKRIAWIVAMQAEPPHNNLVAKVSRILHPQTLFWTSLWISEVNGNDLHEIGRVDSSGSHAWDGPENVQWTPDGKRLSFVYRRALWTVPAE